VEKTDYYPVLSFEYFPPIYVIESFPYAFSFLNVILYELLLVLFTLMDHFHSNIELFSLHVFCQDWPIAKIIFSTFSPATAA